MDTNEQPIMNQNFVVNIYAYTEEGEVRLPIMSGLVHTWEDRPFADSFDGSFLNSADEDDVEGSDSDDEEDDESEEDDDENCYPDDISGNLKLSLTLTPMVVAEYMNCRDNYGALRVVITYLNKDIPLFSHIFDCEEPATLVHKFGKRSSDSLGKFGIADQTSVEVELCMEYSNALKFVNPLSLIAPGTEH